MRAWIAKLLATSALLGALTAPLARADGPDADKHGVDGMKYQKKADERSWDEMREFYKQIFAN